VRSEADLIYRTVPEKNKKVEKRKTKNKNGYSEK